MLQSLPGRHTGSLDDTTSAQLAAAQLNSAVNYQFAAVMCLNPEASLNG
jgi:hypothetical protein